MSGSLCHSRESGNPEIAQKFLDSGSALRYARNDGLTNACHSREGGNLGIMDVGLTEII
jgi:hypothetical protein